MKRQQVLWMLFLAPLNAIPVMGADTDLSQVPETTKKLYTQYKAEYTGHNDRYDTDAKIVADLTAAPDADLCFLDAINPHKRDWQTITARKQLGILNTQRTFDALATGLKSKSMFDRNTAIWEISAFKRPECVPLLVEILNADPEEQVRIQATNALKDYADLKSEPDLLKAARGTSPRLTIAAVAALAPLKSKEGLTIAIGLLEKTDQQELELVIQAVASYRTKASVQALLAEIDRLPATDASGWAGRLRHDLYFHLSQCADAAAKVLSPLPDERLDEWQDWWTRAEPLLNNDLQLKVAATAPRIWREVEYTKNTDDTSLTVEADAKTYRLGDPLRLDLTLINRGKSPISTILPHMPSDTMAYGIKLKRSDTVLVDLAPSDFYEGSYFGPPPFETLAPNEPFRGSICLQNWFGYRVSTPLSEGDYELEITFDSSKFAGIKPTGMQIVHSWKALPVKFSIKGEPLKDSQEILALIAEKTHRKFLTKDLSSPQPARHDSAWRAIFDYGDSRLAPFVEKFEAEHPDRSYYYLNAKNLRPFERTLRRQEQEN